MPTYSATGTWNYSGDDDWFAVQLSANQSYSINLTGAAFTTVLGIYNADGSQPINGGPVAIGGSPVFFTPGSTGTYYLSASGFGTGSYTISATTVADDLPDNPSTPGVLPVGGAATGTVNGQDDQDWFKVSLQADQSYAFTFSGNASSITLYDGNNNELVYYNSYSGNSANSIQFSPIVSGNYYLGVFGYSTGSYTVTAAVTPDDYLGTPATTGHIALGGSVSGHWETSGDSDWFAVQLTAGTSYSITYGGVASDRSLALYSATGTLVSSIYGSSFAGTPATSGTYYVAATNTGAPGAYTLSLTTYSDDHGQSAGYAGTASVGTAITGTQEVRAIPTGTRSRSCPTRPTC